MAYRIFISHAHVDRWVAGQIAEHLIAVGAEPYLDSKILETGDQLDASLRTALNQADELLVLLTAAALDRPYVWIEIGASWIQGKRIAGMLYGVTTSELAARDGTPAFLTGIVLCDLNDIGRYLGELQQRILHA